MVGPPNVKHAQGLPGMRPGPIPGNFAKAPQGAPQGAPPIGTGNVRPSGLLSGNCAQVSDLTPGQVEVLSSDADFRKILARIDAYTIRKVQSTDTKKDKSTWAKVEFQKELVSLEEVARQVKKLNESRKGSVSERRRALFPYQSRQVDKLLEKLNLEEFDPHFQWTLVQLSQTIKPMKNRDKKETTAITCYCKRSVQDHVDARAVYTVLERHKHEAAAQMIQPPQPKQGPGPGGPGGPPRQGGLPPPLPPPPPGFKVGGNLAGAVKVLHQNKAGKNKSPGRNSSSDSDSDSSSSEDESNRRRRSRGRKGKRRGKRGDSSFSDSDSDGRSYYSGDTSISSRSDRFKRRQSRDGRKRSGRSKSRVRQHSRVRLSPQANRLIQDRFAPDAVLPDPYAPYGGGPRPAYVPEVPRPLPEYDPVAAAFHAGKIAADAQRYEVPRAPIVRPIQVVESPPREVVSYVRPITYEAPVVQYEHPDRHERYVDEIRYRDEQRYRDEDLRRTDLRRRRDAEDYIDGRRGSDPVRVIYYTPQSPNPFGPRSSSPSLDSHHYRR